MMNLEFEPVVSETIAEFAYVPEYRDLVVVFRSGGTYRYKNVDASLVKRLRKPHPWHVVGAELRDTTQHEVERLASIRTRPLKRKVAK